MKTMRFWMAVCGIISLMSCENVSLPTDYTQSSALPAIYPDYTNVTIPINIAPLTFEADQPADEMVASYSVGKQMVVCSGQMQPEMDEWRELTAKAKGGEPAAVCRPAGNRGKGKNRTIASGCPRSRCQARTEGIGAPP